MKDFKKGDGNRISFIGIWSIGSARWAQNSDIRSQLDIHIQSQNSYVEFSYPLEQDTLNHIRSASSLT